MARDGELWVGFCFATSIINAYIAAGNIILPEEVENIIREAINGGILMTNGSIPNSDEFSLLIAQNLDLPQYLFNDWANNGDPVTLQDLANVNFDVAYPIYAHPDPEDNSIHFMMLFNNSNSIIDPWNNGIWTTWGVNVQQTDVWTAVWRNVE